jgi:inorganic pyrophosphatase
MTDPVGAPVRPAALHCVIEIPKGSRNKYEFDRELGAIRFDRFVSGSVVYPTDYGFIPEALGEDGDDLDALVCVTEPTFPGCVVPVRAIGLFRMTDENGPDDKVVCVPPTDPYWAGYHDVEDLPRQLREEIFHFFAVYKDLDAERHAEPIGWAGPEDAQRAIADARERHDTVRARPT